MTPPLVLVAVLIAGAPVSEDGWALGHCDSVDRATWSRREQAIRWARPGSRDYLPFPYPTSRREVEADLWHQVLAWQLGRAIHVEERPLADAHARGGVRSEHLIVHNWAPTRCSGRIETPWYHLLRLFDTRSGVELARAALNPAGQLAVFSHATEEQRAAPPRDRTLRLPTLEATVAEVRAAAGVEVASPQYVTTFGTLHCPVQAPCIAMRAGTEVLIRALDGALYRLRTDRPQLRAGLEIGTPETNAAVLPTLAPSERVVSVGGDRFAVAVRLESSPPPF